MRRRFGQLSEQVVAKVHAANTELLETWAEAILDARSIDEVFAD
ncbi:MAG: DUF4351 domain-containing protein [Magnetococcus sp. YQC-5]